MCISRIMGIRDRKPRGHCRSFVSCFSQVELVSGTFLDDKDRGGTSIFSFRMSGRNLSKRYAETLMRGHIPLLEGQKIFAAVWNFI